jgi:uncharacterized protein YbjT (DUF2867 family)
MGSEPQFSVVSTSSRLYAIVLWALDLKPQFKGYSYRLVGHTGVRPLINKNVHRIQAWGLTPTKLITTYKGSHMTTLVIGATGNVGRPTIAGLLAKGESVRALSRSEEKLRGLPDGVEGIVGDLESGDGLDAACAGVDKLFLITANGETETARGLNAVAAAKKAGVKHIVFLTVGNPDKEPAVPHYRAKLPVEDAIRNSGMEHTFLRPNFFMQTDMSIVPVIKKFGVYSMPIGLIGQNRVDTRDVADCAVRVLTEDGHAGADYHLHGPDTLTGPEAAAVYAKHLDKEVNYGGDDVDQWGKPVEGMIPPWLLDSLKKMFLGQQLNGGVASAEEVAASADSVGHPLRTFEEFAAEVSA